MSESREAQPCVSIIIRTHNNEESVLRAVNSVLVQDFETYEILIIDDGSTDSTLSLISTLSDTRVRVVSQGNFGPIAAAYVGIQNAKGELVTFLDADDEIMADAIKALSEPLADTAYGFSYCDYFEVDSGTGLSKYVSLSNFFNILACGVMLRRSVIDRIGFWDHRFILPEYDFLLRVKKRYQGVHVKAPLYRYNRHPKSMTANKSLVEKAKKQIFRKYGYIKEFKKY